MRYDNVRTLKEYLNHEYIKEKIELSKDDEMFEQIMMSLRTTFGLDLALFESRYGISFFKHFDKPYHQHKCDFVIEDNHLIVKHLELLNSLLVDFLD